MYTQRLPNFKVTLVFLGSLYILMPITLFVKGLMPSMAEFKVPEATLQSPHYADAILWVYVHMMVLGALIAMLGFTVKQANEQRWVCLALLLISILYTYLDFRSSDSVLGNALYKGKQSLVPAYMGLFFNLMLLQLFIKLSLEKPLD
jgi:hypothetical protein